MHSKVITLSLSFLIIFTASIPLSFLGSEYRAFISDSSLFQTLNSIFVADYGVWWFTAVFWGKTLCSWLESEKKNILLLCNRILKFVLYILLAVFFNAWFFGPLLVERLNIATGGYCSGSNELKLSMSECRDSPLSQWVDGFDLSGHYYFLVSLSLMVMDVISLQILSSQKGLTSLAVDSTEIQNEREVLQRGATFLRRLAPFIMAMWIMEFFITSIFFHTVWEKASGLFGIPIALSIVFLSDKVFPIITRAHDITIV